MTYRIIHGEVGFDILKDGRVFRVGIVDRADARWAIKQFQKHERTRADAMAAVRKLRESLRDDYGLSPGEISELMEAAKS